MKPLPPNLIAIIGATATGKTSLAVDLATKYDGEIISADSRQVYQGLDLGSGKDLHEYGAIPYHLIDIIKPVDEYNVFQFQQDFYGRFNDLNKRQKSVVLCGGSMMYINALFNQHQLIEVPEDPEFRAECENIPLIELQQQLIKVQPKLHNSTDLNDRDRLIRALEIAKGQESIKEPLIQHPELRPLSFTIDWPREKRTERIKLRLKQRLTEGMIDEVKTLNESGLSWDKLHYFGLEYRFIAQFLQGELSYNDMYQKLASAIVKFAKRQDTWLRKFQRQGHEIHFLNPEKDLTFQAQEIIAERF